MKKKFHTKNATALIILSLLIGFSILPNIGSSENHYNSIALKDNSQDIPRLKLIGTLDTYEDYIKGLEDEPFILQKIYGLPLKDSPLVIIFVESDILNDISEEITLYNKTLENNGYETVIFQVSGVTPQDLKDQIINYWEEGYNVCGSVLIGDLPTPWFFHEDDYYDPGEFPCDLFLMDLDGTWTDTDYDGIYDSHVDGSGDTAPEIYVGRIDASRVPGDEITILKKYFAKLHDFWSNNINRTYLGLTYTDQDWSHIEYFRHDIGYAYEDYEAIWYPNVTRNDYVNNRIPDTYEFIQLSCHSGTQGHEFTSGGWASSDDIRSAPPRALFYNLFCCSSLRYTVNNCLGNAYILDTDTPSLTIVGSSKTGSMLDFRYFYEPIGNGSSFGTAFKIWFEYEYPYNVANISWFYGMTILGDPTLVIHPKNLPPSGEDLRGPNEGIIREEYEFCIDVSDNEGDTIYSKWDWGDGTVSDWFGPYLSGETACTNHSWTSSGNYQVKVNLKDDEGSESGWSEPHPIYILKSAYMKIGKINGGFFKINADIKNLGEVNSTEIHWTIKLDGGLILIGRESSGKISSIPTNGTIKVDSNPILGFGKVVIIVRAEISENTAIQETHGKLLLFYINVNPSG